MKKLHQLFIVAVCVLACFSASALYAAPSVHITVAPVVARPPVIIGGGYGGYGGYGGMIIYTAPPQHHPHYIHPHGHYPYQNGHYPYQNGHYPHYRR